MKVLVYPKDSNPYQDLLYSKFPKNTEITNLIHMFSSNNLSILYLPIQIICFRLIGYRIFHLHWVYTFRILGHPIFQTYPFRFLMTIYFVSIIFLIKLLGYKLVWTGNGLICYGVFFINDIFIMRLLSVFSEAVIVHSDEGIKIMNLMNMNSRNCSVIPTGNYADPYSNTISQKDSRKKLKIKEPCFIFGFFGKIREDKGVLALIQSYIKCNFDNARLYIIGECIDKTLKDNLLRLANNRKDIFLHFFFVQNEDVQVYINSFDVLVYPFINITTSSAVILAMSFKKSVICPMIGDLRNFPKNTGYFYDSKHPKQLLKYMKLAYTNKMKLMHMGENGFHFVKRNSWEKSALLTNSLYIKLLESKRELL